MADGANAAAGARIYRPITRVENFMMMTRQEVGNNEIVSYRMIPR